MVINTNDPIFVYDETRSPLDGTTREDLIDSLRTSLGSKVSSAYIFGSVARDTAGPGSDVDLILVANSSRPFVERFKDFMFLFDAPYELNLLVYTESEFAKLTTKPSSGFWRDIVRDAIKII